ncbi:protein phosphatase 2C [Tritrichomonas foetus]|uniref:Protein phosphatase 2C n=1 Tax=Tritrichomonas foetus TaxID=1144522 RepID=A0A1J4JJU5_9EUKA|nr:protein phosphatase 2C [Tritrichomonas foetus]|eukprot:OHS97508.1 protein phosphatase 2C [Tritrichomonas foetus]
MTLDYSTGLITIPEFQHTVLCFGRHLFHYSHSEINSDDFQISDSIVGIGDFAGSGSAYYAIFEGHNGPHACEYAGQNVHRIFARDFTNDVTPQSLLPSVLNEVHKHISKDWPNEGCSCAILISMKNGLYTANLGDTKIMLISEEGEISYLTENHITSNPDEAQSIQKNGGYTQSEKVCGVSHLTRALGDGKIEKVVSHVPYMRQIKRHDGMVVVIGTAALFESVNEQRIARLAVSHTTVNAAAQSLTKEAAKNGAKGNVSCIVIWLTPK